MILYASELAEFREDDISKAVRKIALTPREEGETAFPDLGTVVKAVKRVAGERLAEEERIRRRAEQIALEEDRRNNPEKYFTYADVVKAVTESRRAKDASEAVA